MDYKELYDQLVAFRKQNKLLKSKEESGKIETHHILPRSCGGTDDPENLVNLYAKEHFMAHYYLWKMHENDEFKYQLLNAFWMMCTMNSTSQDRSYQEYVKMSEEYQEARIQFAKYVSKTVPDKLRGNNNGMCKFMWIRNPETKEFKVYPRNMPIPLGWEAGLFLKKTDKVKNALKKFAQSTKGKRKICNIETNEVRLIDKDAPLPEGYRYGARKLSAAERKKCAEVREKQRQQLLPKKIAQLRPMYAFYLQNGWSKTVEKFNYKYTLANFSMQCKAYLPEYSSHQGQQLGK